MSADLAKLDPSIAPCLCSRRHVPKLWLTEGHHLWPIEYLGPADGEKVALCPTGHYIVHYHHLMPWIANGGPVARRRGENAYLYGVALDGWHRMVAGGWKP